MYFGMFYKNTGWERVKLIYDFFISGKKVQYHIDLGDIYELSSDGTNLMFFDKVKVHRTGKTYEGKEILLYNVTPYNFTNLEESCKTQCMSNLEDAISEIMVGFSLTEDDGTSIFVDIEDKGILRRKNHSKWTGNQNVKIYDETIPVWRKRIEKDRPLIEEMSKGLMDRYHLYFVADDPFMVRPLSFTGYPHYLAFCLNMVARSGWWKSRYEKRLVSFFGSDHPSIEENYQHYKAVGAILGVPESMHDVESNYCSLKEIQDNIRSMQFLAVNTALKRTRERKPLRTSRL
jgi:hypothetical protein